jgi:ankyrin repeat protein
MLIDALCGRGWDAPNEPDLDRARAQLTSPPSDPWTAAVAGDTAVLAALLDQDPEAVNRPCGPRDWPLLCYAGDRTRTDALLAAGASPSDGNSTYHAVETFDLDLLKALAKNGIDHDDASYTLKHALDMGFEDAVRLFLDQGADPNAVHPAAQETSLHWAVKRNATVRVIGWLMDAGADPDRANASGRAGFLAIRGSTPLDYALRLGHIDAAERMGGTPTPPSDEEAFVYAIARGERPAAEMDLDRLHADDRALLAHWAQHGRRDAVALACEVGFDLDSTAWMGLTALHWAAMRGDPVMLKTLLDAGAPVVDLDGYFRDPAHTARTCQWFAGDYAAVLALLETA